jgi:hypothetical protein
MLAVWARHAARLHLNEIDPVRQEILRHLFPDATVTDHDAARISAHLTQRPSVILMNRPSPATLLVLRILPQPHVTWLPLSAF